MQDLDYKSLLIDPSFRKFGTEIKNKSIQEVTESFLYNMDRVFFLSRMPANLMNYATWLGAYGTYAFHEETGQYLPDEVPIDKELSEKLNRRITEFMKKLISLDVKNEGLDTRTAWLRASNNLEVLNAYLEGTLARAIEAVLFSVITGTWTAFEVLAEEMWKVYVNEKPETLLKGRTKPRKRGRYQKDIQMLTLEVGFDDFKSASYNLGGKFDVVLRGDLKFDTFDSIALAYESTTGTCFDSLTIDSDRSLFNLAQTRNAIVHSAGMADEHFVQTMVHIQSPFPEFKDLVKGQHIPINGQLATQLVDQAVTSCLKLINEIDALLLR